MKAVIYWNKNRRCVQLVVTPEGGTRLARVVASFQNLEDLGLTSNTERRVQAGSYRPMARESSEVRDNREAYVAERAKEILEQVQLDKGEKSAGLTVGYAIDQWNEKHWPTLKEAENKPKGLYELEMLKRKKNGAGLADVKLDDLDKAKIAQALEFRHPRHGYSPKTYNGLLTTLSRVLSWCCDDQRKWLETNPLQTGKGSLRQPEHDAHDWLSVEEWNLLKPFLLKSRNEHLYDAVVLTLHTGCRKNEIMTALWSDFDLINGRLVFNWTKNGKSKSINLTQEASDILKDRMKVRAIYSNRIFPRLAKWKGKNKDYDLKGVADFNRALTRNLVKAGINCPKGCTKDHKDESWYRPWYQHRRLHWHSLRHTCASFIANNGGTLEDIQAHLGQEDPDSAKIYKHLVDDYTKKTSSILEKALAS